MSVHRDQQAAAEVARNVHAAHTNGVIPPVGSHIEPPHAPQHVRQRAVPLLLDIVRRDNADGGRGFRDLLLVLGGSEHRVHFYLHQFLHAEVLERLGRLAGFPVCCRHVITRRGQRPHDGANGRDPPPATPVLTAGRPEHRPGPPGMLCQVAHVIANRLHFRPMPALATRRSSCGNTNQGPVSWRLGAGLLRSAPGSPTALLAARTVALSQW